jgi:hypothetical protein
MGDMDWAFRIVGAVYGTIAIVALIAVFALGAWIF